MPKNIFSPEYRVELKFTISAVDGTIFKKAEDAYQILNFFYLYFFFVPLFTLIPAAKLCRIEK